MGAAVVVAEVTDQQHALDDWLARHPDGRRAVLAENGFGPLEVPGNVSLWRLAPGCVCCVGQVPLRVTLTRAVRSQRPDHLLLLLASADHLMRVRALLVDGSLGVRLTLE